MPPLTRTSTLESRGGPDGSEVQTRENSATARATPLDSATDRPSNQEALVSPVNVKSCGSRAMRLTIFCLCLSLGAAIFTVVVLESSRIRLPTITFGNFQAVFLATFSVSLISDACATIMGIFQIFQVGLTDSQLTCWDTYRGAIMNVIDRVVLPVILLNIINACFQYHSGQNVLDCITHVTTIVLFLVWVSFWSSGGQRASAESIELGSNTLQSSEENHANAGEASPCEFLSDAPYTPNPFTPLELSPPPWRWIMETPFRILQGTRPDLNSP